MVTYKDLVEKAYKDKTTNRAFEADGSYNTTYKLSPDEIKVAAANAIASATESDAAALFDSYYIGDAQDCPAVMRADDFAAFYVDVVDSALTSIANNQRPAFFSVSDGAHYVTVALVPDYEDVNKINVVYVNSMPASLAEYSEHRTVCTGKNFAQSLVNYLNTSRGKICGETYTDLSKNQQYGNCCGLSVALNVATVVAHHVEQKPFADLGKSVFCTVDTEITKDMYIKMAMQLFSGEKPHIAQEEEEVLLPLPRERLIAPQLHRFQPYEIALSLVVMPIAVMHAAHSIYSSVLLNDPIAFAFNASIALCNVVGVILVAMQALEINYSSAINLAEGIDSVVNSLSRSVNRDALYDVLTI